MVIILVSKNTFRIFYGWKQKLSLYIGCCLDHILTNFYFYLPCVLARVKLYLRELETLLADLVMHEIVAGNSSWRI